MAVCLSDLPVAWSTGIRSNIADGRSKIGKRGRFLDGSGTGNETADAKENGTEGQLQGEAGPVDLMWIHKGFVVWLQSTNLTVEIQLT